MLANQAETWKFTRNSRGRSRWGGEGGGRARGGEAPTRVGAAAVQEGADAGEGEREGAAAKWAAWNRYVVTFDEAAVVAAVVAISVRAANGIWVAAAQLTGHYSVPAPAPAPTAAPTPSSAPKHNNQANDQRQWQLQCQWDSAQQFMGCARRADTL